MNNWFYVALAFAVLTAFFAALALSYREERKKKTVKNAPPRWAVLYNLLADEHYQLFVAWQKTLSQEELDEFDKLLLAEDSNDGDAERKKRDYDARYRQFVAENCDLVPLIREFIADNCDADYFR